MCKTGNSGRLRKADFEKITTALRAIRTNNRFGTPNGLEFTKDFVALVNTIADTCQASNRYFERKTFKHNVYKG
jgi:hypothetical protein